LRARVSFQRRFRAKLYFEDLDFEDLELENPDFENLVPGMIDTKSPD